MQLSRIKRPQFIGKKYAHKIDGIRDATSRISQISKFDASLPIEIDTRENFTINSFCAETAKQPIFIQWQRREHKFRYLLTRTISSVTLSRRNSSIVNLIKRSSYSDASDRQFRNDLETYRVSDASNEIRKKRKIVTEMTCLTTTCCLCPSCASRWPRARRSAISTSTTTAY